MKNERRASFSDPTGRFNKINDLYSVQNNLAFFKGYDKDSGLEITWCEIFTSSLNNEQKDNLQKIATTIQSFRLNTLLSVFYFWYNADRSIFTVITESSNSKSVLDQIKHGSQPIHIRAISKWAGAVLQALDYLHSQNPPFIHGRTELSSIFVKPSSGTVKLLTPMINPTFLKTGSNVLWARYSTPPEALFNQVCTASDIWSFGIAVLYSVTNNEPYSECESPFELIQKLSTFKPPTSLSFVTQPVLHDFISKCLLPTKDRPSAKELLNHQFFQLKFTDTPSLGQQNGIEVLFTKKKGISPSGSSVYNSNENLLTLTKNSHYSVSTPFLFDK